MDCKWIFAYDLFKFFFRVGKREYNTSRARHLASRCDEHILFIVFGQKLYVIRHVLVELLEWDDVVEIDDEHGVNIVVNTS